jgi:hypothetical protein
VHRLPNVDLTIAITGEIGWLEDTGGDARRRHFPVPFTMTRANRRWNQVWLLKNYFSTEIARKLVCKWLIVRSRNSRESHEITVLVPFSTATGVFTKTQLEQLLSNLGIREQLLVLTAAMTGLRRSELAGLKWSDMDLVNGWISVNRSVDNNRENPCKTEASRKAVPLDLRIVPFVQRWHEVSPFKASDDYVFAAGTCPNLKICARSRQHGKSMLRRSFQATSRIRCGTPIIASFTKYGTKQLIPQAPHLLLLELQRMKPEGSLQIWIVKSDGLGILRVDLKGLE